MNILMFSWRDPKHPLSGGAEQVVHEHAKGWINAGHNVTLFTSRFPGSLDQEDLDGVKIVRKGSQYLGVQLAAFFYYQKNKKKFDFIIDQFHGLPFFTPMYSKKPKLALIQETARRVWFLNPFPQPLRWIVGIIGFLGEPFIFLPYLTTPFITGSNSAKNEVARFFIPKKNITVVPHGVILKIPKQKLDKEKKPTITFLGRLTKDKGIFDALGCFKLLSKNPSFQFWVIGSPENKDYDHKIKETVKSLGLDNRIKFWGFVSQEQKFELLSKSHLLINPSVREGWGLVNIEANSVSTPIISYNSPGLVDSVKDGFSGVICSKNTPQELAKEINALLEDDQKYSQMKENAVEWSKNFSWGESRKKSLELIEKVLND